MMNTIEKGRTSIFSRQLPGGVGLQTPRTEAGGIASSARESMAPISTQVLREKILAEEMDPEDVLALIAVCGIASEEHVS